MRITRDHLQKKIDYLNKITGNPQRPYTTEKGVEPNAGNYHLESEYGGHNFAQMTEGGGTHNPTTTGLVSPKILFKVLNAYIAGYEAATKAAAKRK
jgi:hypothetical protein